MKALTRRLVALALAGAAAVPVFARQDAPAAGGTVAGGSGAAMPPETLPEDMAYRMQRFEAYGAMERGIAFLLKDQNPDGSWGGARGAVYTFTGDVWGNPETHRAWRVGTSGLCCLALLVAADHAAPDASAGLALDRGIDYLVANADVKRPSDWDTMNSWAHIYGLQALAAAYGDTRFATRRDAIRTAGQRAIKSLAECQSTLGGWGYLEFNPPRTAHQQWATSFTTAAGVIALEEARQAGFDVPEDMYERAVRAVARCRLPSGAFTYSVPVIADPRGLEWIDQIKGSLSRIQVCHEALLMAGENVPHDWLTAGLAYFFQEHRFLDIARQRPIPHEAYYKNSGYFYMFGHYYAARIIGRLAGNEQVRAWWRFRPEVMKTQGPDGSMWDYDMHAYHKPYGTAYGVLALYYSALPLDLRPGGAPATAPAAKENAK